ncbi:MULTISPECIES: glycerol-3-phosphate 1-O-acyltransferase PlsB [unclassified Moraxella]|uniref:glycerol-3-phosphate 1-O-acyltransferase PlsB n=1 Tax=unclassified Moraxella TaxID=2685852 RepID=UPI003AF9273C
MENNRKDSNNPLFKQLYRKLSGNLLGLAVKSQLLGEVPNLQGTQANDSLEANPSSGENQPLTFYVLKEYSRSNSLLIDLETQQNRLPPALAKVVNKTHGIDEKTAMIFLHHYKVDTDQGDSPVYSPRLLRLIQAVTQHPTLAVQVIPVTVLWGRAPEKEDSLFNLLTADEWQNPSIIKQLFNIGVKGRDTYVQFHAPKDLRLIIQNAQEAVQNPTQTTLHAPITAHSDDADDLKAIASQVQKRLLGYLDRQQEAILGPDQSDRRNVVDKLLFSPAIQHAVNVDSQENKRRLVESRQLARGYLNEIASDYSYATVRFFDRFLTWLWTQLYDGVEVQHFERVRELALDYEIIYVPCHRSHMDYLLLSYVIYKRGLRVPYVAAGDNLNIPVLGQMLRNGGAFFMRRSFKGNPLYASVFREYVHSMLMRNTPIEYFIEGGRSRSGRLLPPKKGMLAMTVQSHLRQSSKPIVFIPTYIGYERIMEGGTYVGELKGKPKESESLIGLLKASRKIERIFGNVHVSFGKPLFLHDFMQKYQVAPNSLPKDRADSEMPNNVMQMIDNLGLKIMQRINRSVVLNPVTLLSLVLLDTPHGALDEATCIEQLALYQRIAKKLPYDEDVSVTDASPQSIINYGIKLKLLERTPHVLGDLIRIAEGQAPLLSYFRNNILHVYILASLCACLVERNGTISLDNVKRIVGIMYPFLQAELFLKYPIRTLDATLDEHIAVLIDEKILVDNGKNAEGHSVITTPDPNTRSYQQLTVLANSVEQSLERYFMVLALLSQQGSGKLTKEQVIDLGHLLGQRLSVIYEDDMPDFFDRALFSSFIDALERLGYISLSEGGFITFDHRIDNMAKNARFILDLDVMHILQQISQLGDEEIQRTLSELQAKKQKKFSRKK